MPTIRDSHSQSDVYKRRYQIPDIKDISDAVYQNLLQRRRSLYTVKYRHNDVGWRWRRRADNPAGYFGLCWCCSQARCCVNVDLREAQRRSSKRVHRSFSRTAGCSTGRGAANMAPSSELALYWMSKTCVRVPSWLFQYANPTPLKASIALIQPSTPPCLSFMKNNFKISGGGGE